MSDKSQTRLFVPLASAPYRWFSSQRKSWELRGARGQYTPKHVSVGKYVELRRGYSDRDTAIFGVIVEVVEAATIRKIFDAVPFEKVLPEANTIYDAIESATRIVGSHERYICFKIRELTASDYSDRLPFNRRYLDPVRQSKKSTTVRRANSVKVGPYVFDFEGQELLGFVTKLVTKKRYQLTEADARSDGFKSVLQLFSALSEHYPDTMDDSDLTVCHFNLVRKCPTQYALNY